MDLFSNKKIQVPQSSLISALKDARHFQIIYLGSFLAIGLATLGWSNNLSKYGLILFVALFTQYLALRITNKSLQSLKSALITALGLCLLLKTNGLETAAFAAVIAIASKFLIRYKGKHIFNPVNIGLIATIWLTKDAWISPGQWGSHFVLLFIIGALGFLVLKKVDRIDTTITFFLVFGGLQFARSVLYLGWSLDVFIHQISSGTLMIFAFFMITDPMTTPNNRKARILWTTGISIAAFALSNYGYVYDAPIWVLFFASPFVPILDRLFQAEKFEWSKSLPIFKKPINHQNAHLSN